MSVIAADARMPSLRTIFRWRHYEPDFAAGLDLARAAVAERFSDFGWKLAMEATPETAFLTQVRLTQLRWMTRVLSPRTHGALKAVEPPQAPEVTQVLFRHFKIEEHPETGHHRVVGYTPDPDTLQPVRDSEGPWKDPIDTFVSPTNNVTQRLRRLDVDPPPASDRGVRVRPVDHDPELR